MRNVLEIGDTAAKPGEIAKGSLGSVETANGSRVAIPLITINGVQDGPILTVVSGVHGAELSPIGALLQAVKQINPAQMRGALLGIPGANPVALAIGEQKTPQYSGGDLGALPFLSPVNLETATITEKMACYVNDALERSDYVIDMHANPFPAIPFVLTRLGECPNEKVKADTIKIAKAFGVTIIDMPAEQGGAGVSSCCTRHGKASLTSELAGDFYIWDSITVVGTRGILNVMKALGMVDGELEKQDAKVVEGDMIWNGGRLTAHRGGFIYAKKEPGERIPKGEVVIEILDVYGDVVEDIVMPVNGYCWAITGNHRGTHFVPEGTKLAFFFEERSEYLKERNRSFEKGFHSKG
jgi:predicted deacylase